MELSCAAVNLETLKGLDLQCLDAVYLGHPYCLRTRGNLITDTGGLRQAVDLLHQSGKKAYAATPIVPRVSEFAKVEKYLRAAVDVGVDAVEVSDQGVWRYMRTNYSDVSVHVASPMNIYQPETAAFYRDNGARRLVPANELMSSEVAEIIDAVRGVEFALPVHGALLLGMSYACMSRLKFPGREVDACRNQCEDEQYIDMGDWRMRCVGTANVTADDFSFIEFLPQLPPLAGARLETHFDSADKINRLSRIYSEALKAVTSDDYDAAGFRDQVLAVCGSISNGWRFGVAGRGYHAPGDADPYLSAAEKARTGQVGGVADAS